MAADHPSYKYDLLRGHAVVPKTQEGRRTKGLLYTALAVSSLVNLLLVVRWLVPISEETLLPQISRSSYGEKNFLPASKVYAKLTSLQRVFSMMYHSLLNGRPSTAMSIIPSWMSSGNLMACSITA